MTRRMMFGALGVVAAALVAGAVAFAQGPGRPPMHGEMMKRMISTRLDAALDQAKVTPEQRTAIHASRDRAFAALAAQRPDPAQREQMLALFESDQLDPAQLQALHEQQRQRHEAARTAITQAIVEIHDTLTHDQRKLVADWVRAHGPGQLH
jgi:Spy/CpxP family protein refolding chaperone